MNEDNLNTKRFSLDSKSETKIRKLGNTGIVIKTQKDIINNTNEDNIEDAKDKKNSSFKLNTFKLSKSKHIEPIPDDKSRNNILEPPIEVNNDSSNKEDIIEPIKNVIEPIKNVIEPIKKETSNIGNIKLNKNNIKNNKNKNNIIDGWSLYPRYLEVNYNYLIVLSKNDELIYLNPDELNNIIENENNKKISNSNNHNLDNILSKLCDWHKQIHNITINLDKIHKVENIQKNHIIENILEMFDNDNNDNIDKELIIDHLQMWNSIIRVSIKIDFIIALDMKNVENIRMIVYLHGLLSEYMKEFSYDIDKYQLRLVPYFEPQK